MLQIINDNLLKHEKIFSQMRKHRNSKYEKQNLRKRSNPVKHGSAPVGFVPRNPETVVWVGNGVASYSSRLHLRTVYMMFYAPLKKENTELRRKQKRLEEAYKCGA